VYGGRSEQCCPESDSPSWSTRRAWERAPAPEVHIILDNLSAHKSQVVRDFLATHPNVHFHFRPTYSSWLNQVEIWFSKVGDCSRNLYQREESGPQASPLYQRLLSER
jgi:transposase